MKRFSCTFSLAAALATLARFSTVGAATIDVALHEHIVASSPVIRLGDVARVVTVDRQRARQLSAMLLMPAPAPGTQRFLRKREVEDLLAAHGEDLSQLRIDGAAQVAITTPGKSPDSDVPPAAGSASSQPMNRHAAILAGYVEPTTDAPLAVSGDNDLRDEIQRIILNYLETKTGQAGAWRLSCDVPARHLAQLDRAASPPTCSGGTAPWTGRQHFIISFTAAQGAVQFPVYAEVKPAAVQVAVAVNPIARGAVITAADVELQSLESVPATTSRRAPVASVEELIGMEARQAIAPGDVIFTDKVQAPVLVKRGEIITVVSQGGGIRVRTTARARQNGARGELVQVESLHTREPYDARVTGPSEAAVFAAVHVSPAEPPAERMETARR
jgi:flagella basal body P-ring formation protein FlgA